MWPPKINSLALHSGSYKTYANPKLANMIRFEM